MHCELCGRDAEVLHVARIEGAVLRVCRECASLGEEIRTVRVRSSEPVSEEEIVEGFGKIIREARKKKGLSVGELAKLVGISGTMMKKIEDEKVFPPPEVVPRLERELGIELTERADVAPLRREEPITLGDVIRIRRK